MVCEPLVSVEVTDAVAELLREQPVTNRYLVVVVPPVPSAESQRVQFSSYSNPPRPQVRWIAAETEEKALAQVTTPPGSRAHVVDADEVQTFDIPAHPTPVRVA